MLIGAYQRVKPVQYRMRIRKHVSITLQTLR